MSGGTDINPVFHFFIGGWVNLSTLWRVNKTLSSHSVAGAAGAIATSPLELLKTRLQVIKFPLEK